MIAFDNPLRDIQTDAEAGVGIDFRVAGAIKAFKVNNKKEVLIMLSFHVIELAKCSTAFSLTCILAEKHINADQHHII